MLKYKIHKLSLQIEHLAISKHPNMVGDLCAWILKILATSESKLSLKLSKKNWAGDFDETIP